MPKLGIFSGRELCAILQRFGFEEVRQRGSHIVMQQKSASGTVTVPVPDHKELRIGTLQSIIRQTSIAKSEFER